MGFERGSVWDQSGVGRKMVFGFGAKYDALTSNI
jgi:hypothetical protein